VPFFTLLNTEMSGRIFGIVESVLPILTPEQRRIAAGKIRARAAVGEEI